MVVKDEISPTPLPILVKKLLEDFSDIILDELHKGLPPLRDIQHHIDLIPDLACLIYHIIIYAQYN